jgi:hypothetical protein
MSVTRGTEATCFFRQRTNMKTTLLAAAIIIAVAVMVAPAFVKAPSGNQPGFDPPQMGRGP